MILTLRGIFGYYSGLVLKTLKQAECHTPVSCGFFTSIDFLWPSVRLIKDLIRQGIRQPSCFGFDHSATSLSKRAVLNQNINKEANNG